MLTCPRNGPVARSCELVGGGQIVGKIIQVSSAVWIRRVEYATEIFDDRVTAHDVPQRMQHFSASSNPIRLHAQRIGERNSARSQI